MVRIVGRLYPSSEVAMASSEVAMASSEVAMASSDVVKDVVMAEL